MRDKEGVPEVIGRLEAIRTELIAIVKGVDRFQNKRELLREGQDLHRRLGLCIDILKKLEDKE